AISHNQHCNRVLQHRLTLSLVALNGIGQSPSNQRTVHLRIFLISTHLTLLSATWTVHATSSSSLRDALQAHLILNRHNRRQKKTHLDQSLPVLSLQAFNQSCRLTRVFKALPARSATFATRPSRAISTTSFLILQPKTRWLVTLMVHVR